MRAPAESEPDGRDDARADCRARGLGGAWHAAAAEPLSHARRGALVPATRAAVGFPAIPGLTFTDHFVNAVLDYDFGSTFVYDDLAGVIARQPPAIKQVIPTLVPRVNADGNETAGIPSVLHQAPLGTYLGWNIQSGGFFKGQICGFSGGYVPFAVTREDGRKAGDPRPSLEERYGTQEGYVCTVKRAAGEPGPRSIPAARRCQPPDRRGRQHFGAPDVGRERARPAPRRRPRLPIVVVTRRRC